MEIRIKAEECCGGICNISDAQDSNSDKETEYCDGQDSNYRQHEWADD